jgi:endoglucanase
MLKGRMKPIMTPKFVRSLLARPHAILLAGLLVSVSASGAGQQMKVNDSGYLDTQGFSVILYQSTYHPVFVDEKHAAMEMILHGQRIATNGDVRLMPTPEQWDLVAKLKGRKADKEHNRLTADLSFPAYQMDYTLEVTAEPGGVRVSVNLDKPLPEKLAGRAGFNLEFLPSIYVGKSYAVDGKPVRHDSAQSPGPNEAGAAACRRS